MTENEVARETVDVAYRIHSVLGPGLLESVYGTVPSGELRKRGLRVATQQPIPVVYEGTRFEIGFRADLVLEDRVIVEVKLVAEIAAVHKKQLLSYLRLADKRLGLLINFNVVLIKDGIKLGWRSDWRFLASLRLGEKFRLVAHLQHIGEAAF